MEAEPQPQGLSMVEGIDKKCMQQLKLALPSVDDTSIKQYYHAIKKIFDDVYSNNADKHSRRRLGLETIIDAITDFVDKTPNGENRIKSILSSAYSGDFITYLCEYLSPSFRTKSEIDQDMFGIVNHIEALMAPALAAPALAAPALAAPALAAPALAAPAAPALAAPAGPADGRVVFPGEGGKRRSIKKKRKSMSKRRKNRRKSNKKQR
jgi:hypothetical protein